MNIDELEKRYIILEARQKRNSQEYESIREVNARMIDRENRDIMQRIPYRDDHGKLIALFNRDTHRLLCIFNPVFTDMVPQSFTDYVLKAAARAQKHELEDPEGFSRDTGRQEKKLMNAFGDERELLDAMARAGIVRRKGSGTREYDTYSDIHSGFNRSGAGTGFYDLEASQQTGSRVDGFGPDRKSQPGRDEREESL